MSLDRVCIFKIDLEILFFVTVNYRTQQFPIKAR